MPARMIAQILAALLLAAAAQARAQAPAQAQAQVPPEAPAPQQSAATQPPSATVPVTTAVEAPPPGVKPLSLEDALALSLQRNADLINAQLTADSSEQDRKIALAAILPNLGFNASYGRVRQGAGIQVIQGNPFPRSTAIYPSYQAGLQFTQLLFDGGAWWNTIDSAELTLHANRELQGEQKLTTLYTTEQRFYELVRAQRQLTVFGEAARRSREQAEQTQKLYEGGRSTQADVYAARANRDNDEVTRLGQERVVELARVSLSAYIGLDPGQPLAVVEPAGLLDDPPPAPKAAEMVEKALANRPSLKAATLNAEALRKQVAARKGAYYPRVSLGASFGRSTTTFGDFTTPLEQNSQLSGNISLSWNLFNGLSDKANVDKAWVQVLIAENNLANGRRGVASDVATAVAQLAAAGAQSRIARESEGNAQENLRLARTRQQVGVGTQLEVRDAELKLTQSQLARVGALVDGHEAQAALRRAVGG